ncbi:unnamed protein product, partial [Prorocentrum cordatum]
RGRPRLAAGMGGDRGGEAGGLPVGSSGPSLRQRHPGCVPVVCLGEGGAPPGAGGRPLLKLVVPDRYTVSQLKREIERRAPGAPVDMLWIGRELAQDPGGRQRPRLRAGRAAPGGGRLPVRAGGLALRHRGHGGRRATGVPLAGGGVRRVRLLSPPGPGPRGRGRLRRPFLGRRGRPGRRRRCREAPREAPRPCARGLQAGAQARPARNQHEAVGAAHHGLQAGQELPVQAPRLPGDDRRRLGQDQPLRRRRSAAPGGPHLGSLREAPGGGRAAAPGLWGGRGRGAGADGGGGRRRGGVRAGDRRRARSRPRAGAGEGRGPRCRRAGVPGGPAGGPGAGRRGGPPSRRRGGEPPGAGAAARRDRGGPAPPRAPRGGRRLRPRTPTETPSWSWCGLQWTSPRGPGRRERARRGPGAVAARGPGPGG